MLLFFHEVGTGVDVLDVPDLRVQQEVGHLDEEIALLFQAQRERIDDPLGTPNGFPDHFLVTHRDGRSGDRSGNTCESHRALGGSDSSGHTDLWIGGEPPATIDNDTHAETYFARIRLRLRVTIANTDVPASSRFDSYVSPLGSRARCCVQSSSTHFCQRQSKELGVNYLSGVSLHA